MCYMKTCIKQHRFINLKVESIPKSRKSLAEKNGSFNISEEDKSSDTLSPTENKFSCNKMKHLSNKKSILNIL